GRGGDGDGPHRAVVLRGDREAALEGGGGQRLSEVLAVVAQGLQQLFAFWFGEAHGRLESPPFAYGASRVCRGHAVFSVGRRPAAGGEGGGPGAGGGARQRRGVRHRQRVPAPRRPPGHGRSRG